MGIVQAIKERIKNLRQPTYRFPDHIERVRLNPALLALHMGGTHTKSPAVQVTAVPQKMVV